MQITLDITPEELERILASRYRIGKYVWEAMGEAGKGDLPYKIQEHGPSTGGTVAGFLQKDDAELVATMYSVFGRALSKQ